MIIVRCRGAVAVVVVAITAASTANSQPITPDNSLLTSGWELPYRVTMPQEIAAGPLAAQQPFFDDFSWRSFIALNWPAAIGANGFPIRGIPDRKSNIGSNTRGTRVWESWKSAWELFKPTHDPSAFDQYDSYPIGCPELANQKSAAKLLVMTSKADSLIDEFNTAFSGPLIDQNMNYVRYEIKINKTEYDVIRGNRWHFAQNLPKQVNFPSSVSTPTPKYGVLEIKAAWRELVEGTDELNRYYWTEAYLAEPGDPMNCRRAKMGLVGLHIVHKVSPFREWIWSSFEQIDNVPDDMYAPRVRYSLNNGTASPVTVNGYMYPPTPNHAPVALDRSQPLPPIGDPRRTPVQVSRYTPIRSDTREVNAAYQKLLKGTPWEFYQALPTQWPSIRRGAQFKANGSYPTDSGQPFPLRHVANTSAETYFQNSQLSSCMECHYQAATTDFSWVLAIRASSTTAVSRAIRETLILRLQESK